MIPFLILEIVAGVVVLIAFTFGLLTVFRGRAQRQDEGIHQRGMPENNWTPWNTWAGNAGNNSTAWDTWAGNARDNSTAWKTWAGNAKKKKKIGPLRTRRGEVPRAGAASRQRQRCRGEAATHWSVDMGQGR